MRAKRTLAEAHVPFEVPRGAELAPRLASVLEVIYLIFNEGYAATAGDDWIRPGLCDEALRLGRVLAGLIPGEAEVHGLAALMEIQASRLRARVDANGDPVLLPDQDRSRWDRLLIRRGLAALAHAESLPGAFGPYTLQAAIAACHARAATADATDWARIAALYAIEKEIRGSDAAIRQKARNERSRPLVAELERFLREQAARLSPGSEMGKAIAYLLNHWAGLTLFLDDGRVEMDTNPVENQIRPLTLTRKNSLFAGHDEGGRSWARIASLIATCKINSVEPYAWMKATLEAIATGHPQSRIDELLPWSFARTS